MEFQINPQSFDELPLVRVMTLDEYTEAKATGQLPVAKAMFVRSSFLDEATGIYPIYMGWLLSHPEAQSIPLDATGKTDDKLTSMLNRQKHACWAFVDTAKGFIDGGFGYHIVEFNHEKPETYVGAVSALCEEPEYAQYAPTSGWRELIWRNHHIVLGDWLNSQQECKHDYVDMIMTGEANFFLKFPSFMVRWTEEVVRALEETDLEAAKNRKHEKLTTFAIRKSDNVAFKAQVKSGHNPVESVDPDALKGTDGKPFSLKAVSQPSRLYVYVHKLDTKGNPCGWMLLGTVWFDGSARSLEQVARWRSHFFSTVQL